MFFTVLMTWIFFYVFKVSSKELTATFFYPSLKPVSNSWNSDVILFYSCTALSTKYCAQMRKPIQHRVMSLLTNHKEPQL